MAIEELFNRSRKSFFLAWAYVLKHPVMLVVRSVQFFQCMTTITLWKTFYLFLMTGTYVSYTAPENMYVAIADDYDKIINLAKRRIKFTQSLLKSVKD